MFVRRKLIILGALICLGALVICFGITRHAAEPTYGGRSLQYWLEAYQKADQGTEPEIAVRNIGTNALPYLLTWTSYAFRPEKNRLYAVIERLEKFTGKNLPLPHRPYPNLEMKRSELASCGFQILRAQAEPAAPALVSLLGHTSWIVRQRAAYALSCIGSNSIPLLVPVLTNGTHPGRADAQFAIFEMHQLLLEANPALPVLLAGVSDPDPDFAARTTRELGAYGQHSPKVVMVLTNAFTSPHKDVRYEAVRAFVYSFNEEVHSAAPALRLMLNDPDPRIRDDASMLLLQIDDDPPTNAPPQ